MQPDRRHFMLGLAAAATCAALPGAAEACTGITLRGADGSVIFGRTLEWGTFDMLPRIAAVPGGAALKAQAMPDGKPGIAWTARHNAVAIIALGKPVVVDGLNTAGLSVGMFYHPGFAVYAPYDPAQAANSMAMTDLAGFLLTQCASLDEVRAALARIRVAPVVEPALGFPAPVHLIVTEASGRAIVIEAHEGALRLFDTPIGVITNAPTYDWHMTNLRNYVNLSGRGTAPREVDGVTLAPLGEGSGMLGLPGDFTPPSRFIRAAAFAATARPTTGGFDTVQEAFRILDNFNVPVDAVKDDRGAPGVPQVMLSATQWTTVVDLKTRTLYYHTQFDRTIRRVVLGSIDFAPLNGQVPSRPLDETRAETIRDVTPRG
ncbi:linear amide C-N hydrolase [Neoroseomonas lacus]|uniref:Choloylglycine hydrolase n=1 Tax=Neoroseomonas lacus TaxID=287609 RepID=A0A917KZ24_9PROT|nr:linear amide C-N hydrolase [Neoroseomonas lacus]GGJ36734.1 choloylglycine hydrolase [Neoroseomonas lacus]